MKFPNFFIVGAPKCATTSLDSYLNQHPDVFMCPVKESFFFLPGTGVSDLSVYKSYFDGVKDESAIGESSVGYLYDKKSPELIKDSVPDAKIIIVLREPSAMAYSYWRYVSNHGTENLSFEDAISDKEREYRKSADFKENHNGYDWWQSYLYLEKASYSGQVKRFIDMFGREQVKIYIFEDFVNKPLETCADAFSFLGVNSDFRPDCSKIVNEGGVTRFNFVKRLLGNEHPILRMFIPPIFRHKIREYLKIANLKSGEGGKINNDTKKRLQEFFRDDTIKLETILGGEIKQWK